MENTGKIYRKFSVFFEKKEGLKKKKEENNTNSSIILRTNYSHLPLLKIERTEKNLSGNFFNKTQNSQQIYEEIQGKNTRFQESTRRLSVNYLCNIEKNLEKTEENEKIRKKRNFLEKIFFTKDKPLKTERKSALKEIPARFLPFFNKPSQNPYFPSRISAKNSSFPIKTEENPSKFPEKIMKKPKKIQKKLVILPLKTEEISEKNMKNLNIFEDSLNSNRYLQIISDVKTSKANFSQVRKSLRETLDMIFELKLNLKAFRERKVLSTKPFEKLGSYEFIHAAKQGNLEKIEEMLKKNRFLVYDFDYVSRIFDFYKNCVFFENFL